MTKGLITVISRRPASYQPCTVGEGAE